jgi:uncharacterized protein YqeY
MTLKDRIQDDMKAAMRAKDADRLSTVRLLLAAIKQREVDERITLDDAAVVGVVDKMVKQRRDSVAAYQAGGRQDLADKEAAEITVLQAYLPQRLGEAELATAVAALVQQVAAELGRPPAAGDMGKLMALAKAELSGKAEMSAVSAAVKRALQG